ncbi:serine/threonine protein kinase, variant 1 [Aphanomyces astaci]|uniref:Serine/threonine protein kinase, variant 1 n=1 Tax=Aphanomyces astaci TaxID=112090 RepID=W4GEY6_APHAT|nr:serine/threonine protein kinase, variant 1 [Aphanomyces astaci]ETV78257.1 serine/threonine protein kinase, variant 1 [Aphanomyces astaci]|eukprot:XP_009832596.1 serine/threonine protein kinase, variant 1 [Aphanomyces astaci]
MDNRPLYGRENASDTCLYGSVVGLGDASSRAQHSRSGHRGGACLTMELMDDSDDDGDLRAYPPTLSPVDWALTPVTTTEFPLPAEKGTQSTTPREKLRVRRRSRSDSSTTPEKPTMSPTSSSSDLCCDECEVTTAMARVYCLDCDLNYCTGCDDLRHRKGKLALHERTSLPSPPPVEIPVAPLTTEQWTADDVANWLGSLDLQVYETAFQQKNIDGSTLLALPPHELDALDQLSQGSSRGHKKKLQREIQRLKDDETQKRGQQRQLPSSSQLGAHSQLRVTVDSALLQRRRRSDMASPVTALRAKIHQGQEDKGRVVRRNSTATTAFVKPTLDITSEPVPSYTKRRPVASLGLDLNQIAPKSVTTSFDFTAEGKLQSHGFEINTDGITSIPFQTGGKPSTTLPMLLFGTKESLVLLNELGHGASGKVYKALYLPTFKLVAVKIIRVYDQKKRHQMLRELKSLYANFVSLHETAGRGAACQDLVMFYDAFTNPEIGSVSIVLEYMDGGSLEDILHSRTPCAEPTIAAIATSVLKGLAFLHENHQLHRDIKLSNILVNKQGRVKISDFGISRDLESTLAEAMTFTGTLLYMAPERISGGTYSYPSDIWSFGLAIMACAIGKLPMPTEDGYWGVVHAVQEQPSPCLKDYGADFSPDLCDFLDQCLCKDPLKRPSASILLCHPFIQRYAGATISHSVTSIMLD